MHRTMLMYAAIAALAVTAACSTKDNNSLTGTTDYTSVSIASDPTSFALTVGDSAEFTPTASIEPEGVAIANGVDNMTFAFADPTIAEINESGFVQGEAPGSTTLTITYTDVNHGNVTTTLAVPVTVTEP